MSKKVSAKPKIDMTRDADWENLVDRIPDVRLPVVTPTEKVNKEPKVEQVKESESKQVELVKESEPKQVEQPVIEKPKIEEIKPPSIPVEQVQQTSIEKPALVASVESPGIDGGFLSSGWKTPRKRHY